APLDATWLDDAVAEAMAEVRRRGRAIRDARARRALAGRRVILIDDAAATGSTLRAAIRAVRAQGAREIIVAIPVAPPRVVTVRRDGRERAVSPEEIVVGNVLVAGPGDHDLVAGRVVGAGRMAVDESQLTGESDHKRGP